MQVREKSVSSVAGFLRMGTFGYATLVAGNSLPFPSQPKTVAKCNVTSCHLNAMLHLSTPKLVKPTKVSMPI
jgi:hypothetical protein